jgi:hypothetical protein
LEIRHEHTAARLPVSHWWRIQSFRNASHNREVQLECEDKTRLARAGFDDTADRGRLDADHEGLPRSVLKSIAAERRPLGALRDDAHRRL